MNKNLYRIIFSKARNMFIAVGENSKSQTKAAGETTRKSAEIETSGSTALHQHWVVKSLVTSMSLWMSLAPVYAQIQADPAANAANRPVIGVGTNNQGQNVPVVNIQTPVNGVSHNIYKQMDVLSNGVVLNNSRTGAGSAIVGSVGANPFLAKGEARLILNEINSTAATRFEGNLEVAGQRADVIIANPAGINIKGGGFINANKAIFTTGKPQLNADGSLKQFIVDQGKVIVSANTGSNLGLGGNNNNADYVDIYARALELNAQLHANQDINVITGTNTISASLESIESKPSAAAAPALAVDVKSLGGMYANNIYLMGNEKGLGVSNAGTLQAVNSLVVTSAGKIVHSGTISTSDKKSGLVSVATTGTGADADIAVSGSINSYGLMNIDSGNDLNLTAKDITVNYDAETKNSAALIVNAKGNVSLAAGTRINNLSTAGDLYLDAKNITLAANSEIRSNRNTATINAEESLTANDTSRLIAAKDLNINANKDLKLLGSALQASLGSINIQSAADSANLLQLDGGTVYAGQNLNIYGTGDVSLKNLSFNLVNDMTRVKNISVYGGKNLVWDNNAKLLPKIAGKVKLEVKQGLNLTGTAINAVDGIVTLSDTLTLNSALKSDKGIDLTTQHLMVLERGASLSAENNVNLASLEGDIQAKSLKVNSSQGRASIIAHENVSLNSVQATVAAPHADRNEEITDKTVINADQGIVIASTEKGSVKVNSAELTSAKGNLQILGQSGVTIDSNTDVVVRGDNGHDTVLTNQFNAKSISVFTKKGNIDIKNTAMTSTADQLHLNSEAGMLTVNKSTLKSKGNTEIYAKDILTLKNVTANTDQHLALNTQQSLYLNANYTPTSTVWSPTDKTSLTAKGVLSVTSAGTQLMQNTTLTGGAVLVEAKDLDIKSGLILNATGSDLLKNDEKLNSLNGDLSIQTTGTTGLKIDPKIMSLAAVGDIDLVAKNGALTLVGYSGTQGNGSEQVVKLNTTGGGINLQGKKVELQGSQLATAKDISIVSTDGDLIIDGVKNQILNKSADEKILLLNKKKSVLVKQIEEIKGSEEYKQKVSDIKILVSEIGEDYETWDECINTCYESIDILSKKLKDFRLLYQTKATYSDYGDGNQINLKLGSPLDNYLIENDENIAFYSSVLNGYEHQGAAIISNNGKINLVSNKGVSISGSTIDAKKGTVNVEAAGTLVDIEHKIQGKYQSINPTSVKQGSIKGSIIIDGLQDSYEIGQVADDNYNWRSPVNVTTINGDKGVKIKATGKTATDNLILQGVGITSNNGDVNIEVYKNIIFDVAVENGYDKSKTTETKSKWYGKKKTITTVNTAEQSGGVSVNIDAKNINIKSQEMNTAVMTGQNRTSIDMYSSQLTANGGKISIQAGGDINFLTANDESLNTTDISKKSSFIGIKLNSSKTTNTRNIKSELPAVLNADYIGTKSGFDTRLKGTVFNYLEGANIQAGGVITLEGASTTVTETLKKESNSVVWQSTQDKGSITETAKLPSFNGPTAPVFQADGGLIVQIPIGEKDQNKIELRDEIIKLANQPGNAYLKDFVNRKDVDWQKVILVQKDWDYKQQGLTAAGAAILAIVIAAVTAGAGVAALGTTTLATGASTTVTVGAATVTVGVGGSATAFGGTLLATTTAAGVTTYTTAGIMINAALTSLATQASIGLVNNQGDISKTLKELGSKESIKSLATAVVTAGLVDKVGASLNIKLNDMPQLEKFANNFVQGVSSNIISSTVQGGSLSDNLEKALLAGLASSLQGELAQNIKQLEDVNYMLHKIAHAAAGCIAGALQRSCEAGAIGAVVGEIAADLVPRNKELKEMTQQERNDYSNKVLATSQILAGTVSAYTGYDVNIATNSAIVAVKNNFLYPKEKAYYEAEYAGCSLKRDSTACREQIVTEYMKLSKQNDQDMFNSCSNQERWSHMFEQLKAYL